MSKPSTKSSSKGTQQSAFKGHPIGGERSDPPTTPDGFATQPSTSLAPTHPIGGVRSEPTITPDKLKNDEE
jgi:hypothetical protein